MLIAIAYGLLGHTGFLYDYFTDQHAVTQKTISEPISSAPAIASGDSDNGKSPWNLILVNKWNPIPDNYDVSLTQLSNGQSVDTRIYRNLQEMFDAAREDGVYPVVAAGYRTSERQKSLLDEKIAELESEGYSVDDAQREAELWVAIPGTSEHQLGIAVDINADGIHSAGTEVYEWLSKNAWNYGFILRYPSEKTEITGCSYEPWHYRYVGKEAAEEIYRQGLCLEEYSAQCDEIYVKGS